uniref:F-box only protein 2-like n=1 Tax=Gouania willdenowi TaxID=441366 RepID=A0A8C5NFC4_GOUWI
MARNLIKNPSGEGKLAFWKLTENNGVGMMVEDIPGACGHDINLVGVRKFFATSFELCLKSQLIDLLAEGYSAEQLDSQPVVAVEDWYSGRKDCGSVYQITVQLLDENKEVIARFQPLQKTLDPEQSPWTQVIHTFSHYGRGLRFVSFEHGGKDTKFWKGWYGVRVTGSSVKLFHPLKGPLGSDGPTVEEEGL